MGIRHEKYTKENLTEWVKESISLHEVLRRAGRKMSGGNHTHLKRRLIAFGIDTSHFSGQAHLKGKSSSNKLRWEDILVYNRNKGRRENIVKLRRALIESGKKEVCDICDQQPVWRGAPLVLEVHHKTGDFTDNVKTNLMFLCSNCHQQVDRGLIKLPE